MIAKVMNFAKYFLISFPVDSAESWCVVSICTVFQALGACKHAFHMHCIVKWTETQNAARPQCPLCRQEWKFAPG